MDFLLPVLLVPQLSVQVVVVLVVVTLLMVLMLEMFVDVCLAFGTRVREDNPWNTVFVYTRHTASYKVLCTMRTHHWRNGQSTLPNPPHHQERTSPALPLRLAPVQEGPGLAVSASRAYWFQTTATTTRMDSDHPCLACGADSTQICGYTPSIPLRSVVSSPHPVPYATIRARVVCTNP